MKNALSSLDESKIMAPVKASNMLKRIKDTNIHGKVIGKIPHKQVFGEFREFLKEYKVIGLAVAFVMGMAATTLVKSLVDSVIMPLITPFIPGGGWETATLAIGPFLIAWGAFLAALINFIMIAFAVFLIAKIVLKEEKVTKK